MDVRINHKNTTTTRTKTIRFTNVQAQFLHFRFNYGNLRCVYLDSFYQCVYECIKFRLKNERTKKYRKTTWSLVLYLLLLKQKKKNTNACYLCCFFFFMDISFFFKSNRHKKHIDEHFEEKAIRKICQS